MFGPRGLLISQLVERLLQLQDRHGDVHVMVSAGDYPEGCLGARYNKTDQPYYPANTVVVE